MTARKKYIAFWVVLIAALGFLSYLVVPYQQGRDFDLAASSYNASAPGLMAFYLYLEESGYMVTRHRKLFSELNGEQRVAVLSTPSFQKMEIDDSMALAEWIDSGGVLIYLVDYAFNKKIDEILNEDLEVKLKHNDLSIFNRGKPDVSSVSPTFRYPLLEGIESLTVSDSAAFEVSGDNGTVLFADMDGPALIHYRRGNGHLYMARSAISMSNRAIGEGDNLAFWQRVLDGHGGREGIVFCEYYHGYQDKRRPPLLSQTRVQLILLQALLVSLIYIAARSRRFGGMLRIQDKQRRSTLEYVESMSRLYRKAKAEEHVRGETLSGFLRKASRKLGIDAEVGPRELSRRLCEACDTPEEQIHRLLTKGDSYPCLQYVRELSLLEQRLQNRK
jgi:Domain of unknown function (DUF4350)